MKKLIAGLFLAFAINSTMLIADEPFITLQSTTSTANSGLYTAILPVFRAESGIKVNVVPVGTGQAIKNAKNGDGDVVLVHAQIAEEKFIAEGFGVERFDVMYNDFVLIGPGNDPASVFESNSISTALKNIAISGAIFVSRGDDSGTHKKEKRLWNAANIDPMSDSGKWYRETGSGMGATLNAAVGMNAYTLTDRGTWISFSNKQNLELLYEGDDSLFNQYGVILVSPERHPHVKQKEAQVFIDWLLGENGQRAIGEYKLVGQQLFFPNAN
ncbi:MAG: sulfate transporter [Gammaproteobacteria bacterium]|nr:sulfate transporter [Gammaproteobacteria bacterium]